MNGGGGFPPQKLRGNTKCLSYILIKNPELQTKRSRLKWEGTGYHTRISRRGMTWYIQGHGKEIGQREWWGSYRNKSRWGRTSQLPVLPSMVSEHLVEAGMERSGWIQYFKGKSVPDKELIQLTKPTNYWEIKNVLGILGSTLWCIWTIIWTFYASFKYTDVSLYPKKIKILLKLA